jgi:hypothetical protein
MDAVINSEDVPALLENLRTPLENHADNGAAGENMIFTPQTGKNITKILKDTITKGD